MNEDKAWTMIAAGSAVFLVVLFTGLLLEWHGVLR